MSLHQINVSNLGIVYQGQSEEAARRQYVKWAKYMYREAARYGAQIVSYVVDRDRIAASNLVADDALQGAHIERF